MNTFIKNILKFIAIIVVVFFTIHLSLDYVLKNNKRCDNTWSKVFKGSIVTDIAIIGNSRAEAHYNTNIISDIIGLKCYNLGLSGTPINIYNIRWHAYINRNKLPKILILDVDYNFLGTANGLYEAFQYVPYVNELEYTRVVKQFDDDILFDQYIPLYKFRGNFNHLNHAFKSVFSKNCHIINGFKINSSPWHHNEWENFKTNRLHEVASKETFIENYEAGFNQLKDILNFCNNNQIKVYMFWSPQYKEVQKFKENQRVYVDSSLVVLANTYKVNYINYSRNNICDNKLNFYNHSHLNFIGANKFSKMVANYIKQDFCK